jgi:hypothetical protein
MSEPGSVTDDRKIKIRLDKLTKIFPGQREAAVHELSRGGTRGRDRDARTGGRGRA